MSEFSVIIFSRRTGRGRAHGHNELRAWIALAERKFPDRSYVRNPEFFGKIIRQKRIDHKAVNCGLHGQRLWQEYILLQDTINFLNQQKVDPNGGPC